MNTRPDKNKPYARMQKLKHSAESRGMRWELTEDDDWFSRLWNQPCSICGADIDTIGVTTFNPKSGYVSYNLLSCCTPCNREKSSKTLAEYEQWRRSKGKIVL